MLTGGSQDRLPLSAKRLESLRALRWVLGLTGTYAVAEVVGAIFTGSLALLADAGHMFTDIAALALALFAAWFSQRPPSPRRSYGYHRAEILAALLNGLGLFLLVAYIWWVAAQRLQTPPEVKSLPMLGIAIGGLVINLASAGILLRTRKQSLNVQGAFLNVMGDALGSVGAISAGVVMLTTGWYLADPIASFIIGSIILWNAWHLVRNATHILLEGTPDHIDLAEIERTMLAVPGVQAVHDLHVWSLTTGYVAMSGHVVMDEAPKGVRGQQDLLLELRQRLEERFKVHHTTIQLELTQVPNEDTHELGEAS